MGEVGRLKKYTYVSCAYQDMAAVGAVQHALESAGIRVWRDAAEVWPGEDWQAAVRRAISGDPVAFLAFFSSTSLAAEKSQLYEELLLAVSELRRRRPLVPWLIPIRLDDCEIPDLEIGAGRTLRSLRSVDLFGPGKAKALARLVAGLSHGIGSAQVSAASDVTLYRSSYMHQVKRIAPPELLGRKAELAELAMFCTEPGRGPYVWWRGSAWAGKSALLSTFVLSPPAAIADRVRLVSFFVTSRLAAQNTREAFTQVLLDQLAALTEQDLPAVLPEASHDAFVLDLLSRTAAHCQTRHQRLVLVVDGLDEDRSVTTGPHAHSIAGLLPGDLPAGMRVIVAGRPDPPVPDDVPDWHPLRNPAIIRPLKPSPHARDIERLARQELRRLLHGTPAEQDILSLLTAARGGLSAPDLADLAGLPLWEAEDILRNTQGRTFTSRPSQYRPGTAPDVYVLGHEELQVTADLYLGPQLPDCYDRLAAWASRWKAAEWPSGTPEYLLGGYFRLLNDLGDVHAMAALAGSAARHDRMLDITEGDAAALAEIRSALDKIAAQEIPDLLVAFHLAYQRDELTERNTAIPSALPAVWAMLGNASRSIALAHSIPDKIRHAESLAQIAEALAWGGQHGLAADVARQAELAAWRAPSDHLPYWRPRILAQVAVALESSGRHEQAVTVTRSITDPERLIETLARRSCVLTRAGQPEKAAAVAIEAMNTAGSLSGLDPVRTFLRVVRLLAEAQQHEQAIAVAIHAEKAARSSARPFWRAHGLAEAARALADVGKREWAAAVAVEAEAEGQSITDGDKRARILAEVAGALAYTGQYELATAVARSVIHPFRQAQALVQVANALADTGQTERAVAAAEQAAAAARSVKDFGLEAGALAEVSAALANAGQNAQAAAVARSITHSHWQADAVASAACALASAGQHQQAAAMARSIPDPEKQLDVVVQVAGALARAGLREQAAAMAAEAEAAARVIAGLDPQAGARHHVAKELAQAGHHGQAAVLARSISDPTRRASALIEVASGMAKTCQQERGGAVADEAEAAAHSIPDPYLQAETLTHVAGVLARVGQRSRASVVADKALTAATSITEPGLRDKSVGLMTATMTDAEQWGQAEAMARNIINTDAQAKALMLVVDALVKAGQHGRAEDLARSIRVTGNDRAEMLAQLSELLIAAGNNGQATSLADEAEMVTRSIPDAYLQPETLTKVARALASAGRHHQAAALLGQAEAMVRLVTESPKYAGILGQIAAAHARAGRHRQADTVADQAEKAVRSVTETERRADAAKQVASALAGVGLHNRAATIVTRSITDPDNQVDVLEGVTWNLAKRGHHGPTLAMANQAIAVARSVTNPRRQSLVLVHMARVLANAGQHERAAALAIEATTAARSITEPNSRIEPLATVALLLADIGEQEQAATVAIEAMTVTESTSVTFSEAQRLVDIAGLLAASGQYEQATAVARSITNPDLRARAEALAATLLAAAGETTSANRLAAAAFIAGRWEIGASSAVIINRNLSNDLEDWITKVSGESHHSQSMRTDRNQ